MIVLSTLWTLACLALFAVAALGGRDRREGEP